MLLLLKLKNAKNLTKELNTCNDSIFCLRTENVSLIANIEDMNACKKYLHLPLSMSLALDVEILMLML
jgi:hypothetical protein